MKKILPALLLIACLAPAVNAKESEAPAKSPATESALPIVAGEDIVKAQAAISTWLAQADRGKYAEAWESSASLFKGSVDKKELEKTMSAVRAPLGSAKERSLKSLSYSTTLPKMIDGQYVVVHYITQFEKKAHAMETVTSLRDKDGAWRVYRYTVK